jgi:hypothetical protein
MNKQFETLKKKFKLPAYEDLDRDFQISNMDEKEDILRGITRHVYETYDAYCRLLEELIQPETKISTMKEASELNAQDKKILADCHRRIMLKLREFIELGLEYSDKNAAKMIIDSYKEWQSLKPDLKKIASKLKDTWQKQAKLDSERGYFG